VEERFYIGWKAPVGPTLKIGLDLDNNAGDKMFVNINGTWVQNTEINGSLMIRPVFGSADIITGVEEEQHVISVYPNPSSGEFYLKGEFDTVHITTITGHPVTFTLHGGESDHMISIQNVSPGLYILKVRKGERFQTEKLIIK
jgi:hypothetical protein